MSGKIAAFEGEIIKLFIELTNLGPISMENFSTTVEELQILNLQELLPLKSNETKVAECVLTCSHKYPSQFGSTLLLEFKYASKFQNYFIFQ